MEKDLIFFDKEGLTSTSANHIANLAKELVKNHETELSYFTLYDTTVTLVGTDKLNTLQFGITEEQLANIPTMLDTIAQAKSLIAWLREAIKAKKNLLNEIDTLSLEDYCQLKGIEYPEAPKLGHILTEDEYYSSLSLKERNAYYKLETYASVLGKAVHPDGTLAIQREKLMEKINNPHKVEGGGRDTLIYNYTPSVATETVETVFFELQKRHREIQSQLNSIKYKCEEACTASELKENAEFNEKYTNYKAEVQALSSEWTKYKKEKSNEISKYKIVIPDSLKNIYLKVSELGK